MLTIDIPGFGELAAENLVMDLNGTLGLEGVPDAGVVRRLRDLSQTLTLTVLTSDTHGRARDLPTDFGLCIERLTPGREAEQKAAFVRGLGAAATIAIGNGANDRAGAAQRRRRGSPHSPRARLAAETETVAGDAASIGKAKSNFTAEVAENAEKTSVWVKREGRTISGAEGAEFAQVRQETFSLQTISNFPFSICRCVEGAKESQGLSKARSVSPQRHKGHKGKANSR